MAPPWVHVCPQEVKLSRGLGWQVSHLLPCAGPSSALWHIVHSMVIPLGPKAWWSSKRVTVALPGVAAWVEAA